MKRASIFVVLFFITQMITHYIRYDAMESADLFWSLTSSFFAGTIFFFFTKKVQTG